MKNLFVSLVILVAFAVGAVFVGGRVPVDAGIVRAAGESPLHGLQAVVFKSPARGCRDGYVQFLQRQGVHVDVVSGSEAGDFVRVRRGVPHDAQGCHTLELDGYVVEGNVPLEALEALVSTRPEIDGLALPGMPLGTPGMNGAPIHVLQLRDGRTSMYMTL